MGRRGDEKVSEHLTDVEVDGPLDRTGQPVDLGLVANKLRHAQDAVEDVVQLDDQEVIVGGEAVESVWQRHSPPRSAVGLAAYQLHNDLARTILHANMRQEESSRMKLFVAPESSNARSRVAKSP
jgi:hypothetical protein